MSDFSKRILTDNDMSQSGSFNRTDTSPELTAQLRNVGARIRKSVTEGYITPPTSRAFTKAQSTATIFSSAKDINRDVFGSASKPPLAQTNPVHLQSKRSRSADRGSDTEPDESCDPEIETEVQIPTNIADLQRRSEKNDRIIKPLRKHRGMMETRSLPVGAFRFSNQPLNLPATVAPTLEEEDWSMQPSDKSDQSDFQPLILD